MTLLKLSGSAACKRRILQGNPTCSNSRLSAFCLATAQCYLPGQDGNLVGPLLTAAQLTRSMPEPSAWPSEECLQRSVCSGGKDASKGTSHRSSQTRAHGPAWPLALESGFSLAREPPATRELPGKTVQLLRVTQSVTSSQDCQRRDLTQESCIVLLSLQRICAEELAALPSSSLRLRWQAGRPRSLGMLGSLASKESPPPRNMAQQAHAKRRQ